MKNHDFHLKHVFRLMFHMLWQISTKKFRLMKKKKFNLIVLLRPTSPFREPGLIEKSISLGINTFDHADIYGGYTTEKSFGIALSASKINRESIFLISKCGIQYPSEKRPLK